MGCCCSKNHKDKNGIYTLTDDPEASLIYAGLKKEIRRDRFTAVEVAEGKQVLVTKCGSKFYAIGGICPHAGFSLRDAPIRNGRTRCPQHGACFDIATGEAEDFPAFDCVPRYKVKVRNRQIYVVVNPKHMPTRLIRPMASLTDSTILVTIIGTGPCGYSCAQTLRQEGFNGRITMITKEKYLPYDRTLLSKKLDMDFDSVKIRAAKFYVDYDIEVLLNKTVKKIDAHNHLIYFDGHAKPQIMYHTLLLAVGYKPRMYATSVPGFDLANIRVLQTLEDYIFIREKARDNDVVLAGSSFVGMEVAELLSPIAKTIHILSRSRIPYGVVFGAVTATALLEHMLEKLPNITFHPTDEIKQFLGSREVSAVFTTKKQKIRCQLVVIGIGGLPNTEFLEDSGIALSLIDYSITVTKYLETSLPHIYAGGDAVSFPFALCSRDRATVSHWQVACAHGKVAALNMMGHDVHVSDIVPYFCTDVCGINIRYLGYGEGYDEIIIYGSLVELVFCSVYRRQTRLSAICCVNCNELAAQLALELEVFQEWVGEIPEPIVKYFSGPPVNVAAYHDIRYETATFEHDYNIYKKTPEVFRSTEKTEKFIRRRHIPLGFDLSLHHQADDTDKELALELQNLRKDQEYRRQLEMSRYGKVLGNVSQFTGAKNVI